ncbi:hypothetical protein [Enhygromyxa salina]|uniref:Uncharacterized protein n=1 Tax=Enhygromyxa salina TaxID=215803 RepID=A0A2S9YUD2_9BACT|nr:hypothetical protein [Enhygromyxa salina]PRQ08694.1 hypothetical protein ENSA7_15940 [Enhygromyxa salina]
MPDANRNLRAFGPLVLALAAVAGLTFGACKPGEKDTDEPGPSFDVQNSCKDYCRQAKMCDDSINEQNCRDNCNTAMKSCQADEQKQAINRLDECGKESCGDFVGCTVDVGAQCVFGI